MSVFLLRRLVLRVLFMTLLISAFNPFLTRTTSLAQQQTGPRPISGGQGVLFLSQFANPALVGSLYATPVFPLTGLYPVYPGTFVPVIPEDGLSVGPLVLHPHMGFAEMYTDNVFRTDTNRKSDFSHTLAPGLQAQLPVLGRHMFVLDYRTNLQYYERSSSNDVQDQTASGQIRLDFPGGLKVDLMGEYKVGHDPRGTALDIQTLEVNKWHANSFGAVTQYFEGQVGARFTAQMIRWNYQNNNQDVVRDRLSNYAALTLLGHVTAQTSALVNFGVEQQIYDQNKNLDSTIYTVSGGGRWEVTALTTGEIQIGTQVLKFTNAQVNQPGPVLNTFRRDRDSYSNFFLMGNLNWTPTSFQVIGLQAYRTIQQTALAGTQFFVATGVNLSFIHNATDRIAVIANLGYENDAFSGATTISGNSERTDTVKNLAVGFRYRTVKWLGASFQYAYEDRSSDINRFAYHANTFTLALEALF